MSFFLKFVSKKRLENSWIGKFGSFFQRSNLNIIVRMLDGTDLHKDLLHDTIGSTLFNKVTFDIDLMEVDYFGLQFVDICGIQHWLDPAKKIKPQLKRKSIVGPPYVLHFRVKFYTHEPGNLHEEVTRYQFFLQLKQDILEGRLKCSEEKCVELAALALQAELGDYEEVSHTPEVISEFRFVEDQTPAMEALMLEKLKTLKGLTPAQAERSYIDKLRWHDDYGVVMHEVEGKDNMTHMLGLSPAGIHFYHHEEPDMIIFFWNRITKLYFKRRMLSLVVLDYNEEGDQIDNFFAFRLPSTKACKSLWKHAVEQHAFFQLKSRPTNNTRKNSFFRRGSKFRYSGRTQFETASLNISRRNVSFERRPSQRFSRRDVKTDDARSELQKEIMAKKLLMKYTDLSNEKHCYIDATEYDERKDEEDKVGKIIKDEIERIELKTKELGKDREQIDKFPKNHEICAENIEEYRGHLEIGRENIIQDETILVRVSESVVKNEENVVKHEENVENEERIHIEKTDKSVEIDNEGKTGININSQRKLRKPKLLSRPLGPPPEIPTKPTHEVRNKIKKIENFKESHKTTEL